MASHSPTGAPWCARRAEVVGKREGRFNFPDSDSALSSAYNIIANDVVAPQGLNVALALKPVYLCAGFYPIEADNLLHAAFLFAVWKARRRFGPGGICSRLMVHAELTPYAGSFEATLAKGVIHEPYRFTVLIDASGRREMVSPP